MKDCDKDIRNYHNEQVKLTSGQESKLRDRRDANRDRVRDGMDNARVTQPRRFVSQGSYAMRTIIQERDNEYDIDDGVVFSSESLKGPRGADMTALQVRHMVCDAVNDGSFKRPPEVRTNCVRVYYSDGPHVDLPVYREVAFPEDRYELASSKWTESDPEGVSAWFKDWLDGVGKAGREQIRQIIRLLKSICANRPSYSLPSGFVLTVLVQEAYLYSGQRLDSALRTAMLMIRNRLACDLQVRHPVVDEYLVDAEEMAKTGKLRDLLSAALDALEVLDTPNCTRSRALKVWKKILATDYFCEAIEQAEQDEKKKTSVALRVLSTSPKPYGYTE